MRSHRFGPARRAFGLAPTLLTAAVVTALAASGTTAALGGVQLVAGTVDITDMPGSFSSSNGSPVPAEALDKAFDNTPYYKYFSQGSTGWIQYSANTAATATSYALTSANDSPDRNPKSWVFEASTNNSTWVPLDTRTNQSFVVAFNTKTYTFSNSTAYRYYRIRITANNGSPDIQVGEFRIFGTSTATAPQPSAPGSLTAAVPSCSTACPGVYDQIVLNWTDTSRYETGYRVERSLNNSTWSLVKVLPPGTTRYRDLKLSPGTHYYYRVRADGSTPSAYATANATTAADFLPTTWAETWHGGGQDETLTKFYGTSSLAIYRDSGLTSSQIDWIDDFTAPLWTFTQNNYANLSGQRLYIALHDGPGSGGFAENVFDESSQHKDLNDLHGDYTWQNTAQNRDDLTHEMGHIVEGAGYGIHGSPAYNLWHDSKWNEAFQYSLYDSLSDKTDRDRWYADKINTVDDFPVANTHWFRDWFYPIYHDHGGTATLNKFFLLLSQNFHALNGEYQRDLNWGEFVFFWSGAAGVDLRNQANNAFGSSAQRDAEFAAAQADYPAVTFAP